VSSLYVDTSALGRVLLEEAEKPAIERTLADFTKRISSHLLRIELRRLGFRHGLLDRADLILADLSLFPLDQAIQSSAETIQPPTVATLDAIHLATAVRLAKDDRLDTIMTYDKQLAAGAREHGLKVLSPK